MTRKLTLILILLSLIPLTGNADSRVLKNDVQLTFKGADPVTNGLILEGTSIGEYGSGTVRVLAFPFKLVDDQLSVSAQWTFTDASGASMTGANSGRLDLGSLTLRERGTVLTCFGELSHLCGCPFSLKGFMSGLSGDLDFIPEVTSVYARASITPAKRGDCFSRSKHRGHKDDDDDDD